jgi:uncharacterized protein
MEKIYIPNLKKSLDHTLVITVDQNLPDLDTLTAVRGQIKVKHGGTYIEVSAKAETIMTLTCNRCLKQYNHRVDLKTSEIIWLDEGVNEGEKKPFADVEVTDWDTETTNEDLTEKLHPQGHFEPDIWLYEQLCLSLPSKQICGEDCEGIAIAPPPEDLIDSRWAALKALKEVFKDAD